MARSISIGDLSEAIMEGLMEYADSTTDEVKAAVKKAGNTTKKEISANAPKRTGAYAKSWKVTKGKETSNSISLTVHSKNRYQLAHLLEFGHANRNGGRTRAKPHIKEAEEKAIKELEASIRRGLGGH